VYVDAHSHIDRFEHLGEGELEAALDAVAADRILTISNSMDLPSYARNQAIATRSNLILPTFGIHPWNAPQYHDRLEALAPAIESSPMVGEAGLDHYWVKDSRQYPAQEQVLIYLLGAAEQQNKVVSLHTKGAEEEILNLLDRFDLPRVIIHWYAGPLDVFQSLASRGVYFTIGVEVLYSAQIQRIAQLVPGGQLLTETDNPGGPKAFLGRPGTPALIHEIARGLAGVRNTSPAAVQQTVRANLQRLIGDDPWIPDSFLHELWADLPRETGQAAPGEAEG
jgi:TatD DNase family protein